MFHVKCDGLAALPKSAIEKVLMLRCERTERCPPTWASFFATSDIIGIGARASKHEGFWAATL